MRVSRPIVDVENRARTTVVNAIPKKNAADAMANSTPHHTGAT